MSQVSQQKQRQNQSIQSQDQSTMDIFCNQYNHIVVVHQSTIPIQKNTQGIIKIQTDHSLQQMSRPYYRGNRNHDSYYYPSRRYQQKKIRYRQKTEADCLNEQSSRTYPYRFQQKLNFSSYQGRKQQITQYSQNKIEGANTGLIQKNLSQQRQGKDQQKKHKGITNQQQNRLKWNITDNSEYSQKICGSQKQNGSYLSQLQTNKLNKVKQIQEQTQIVPHQTTNQANLLNIDSMSLDEEIKEILMQENKQKPIRHKKKQKNNSKQTVIILANSNLQDENSLTNNSKILDSFKSDSSDYIGQILDYSQRSSLATIEVKVQFKGPISILKIKSFNLNIGDYNFEIKLDKKDRNGKYICEEKYQEFLQIMKTVHVERRQYVDSFKEADFNICQVKLPYQAKTQIIFSKENLILAPINIRLFTVTCYCFGKFSAKLSSGVTCPYCSLPSVIQIINVALTIE